MSAVSIRLCCRLPGFRYSFLKIYIHKRTITNAIQLLIGTCNPNPQGPVLEKLVSTNPGLKLCSVIIVLSLLYLGVKAEQYFASSSCMFLRQEPCLKFGLILG